MLCGLPISLFFYPTFRNEVFYSNRSAAHAALDQWEEALKDARQAASLKPSWAKAYQRMGAAYMALKL
jgi:stress-induced-phosphoprotein 1